VLILQPREQKLTQHCCAAMNLDIPSFRRQHTFLHLFFLKTKINQSCKRVSFWSPNPVRSRNHKPEPSLRLAFIFEARFRPESQIYCVSQNVRNCGIKHVVNGTAAGRRFYHTQNSNHLDQNIGLNKHNLSLLVHDNIAECNVSQERKWLSWN